MVWPSTSTPTWPTRTSTAPSCATCSSSAATSTTPAPRSPSPWTGSTAHASPAPSPCSAMSSAPTQPARASPPRVVADGDAPRRDRLPEHLDVRVGHRVVEREDRCLGADPYRVAQGNVTADDAKDVQGARGSANTDPKDTENRWAPPWHPRSVPTTSTTPPGRSGGGRAQLSSSASWTSRRSWCPRPRHRRGLLRQRARRRTDREPRAGSLQLHRRPRLRQRNRADRPQLSLLPSIGRRDTFRLRNLGKRLPNTSVAPVPAQRRPVLRPVLRDRAAGTSRPLVLGRSAPPMK